MVIDSSALIAILMNEEDASRFAQAIQAAPMRFMSAASLVETSMVIEASRGGSGTALLDSLIYHSQIEIMPVDAKQVGIARMAFRRFGKGRHPAKLNFGDCFSYALAQVMNEPLLFKGNDFSLADVLVC